jgi:hypothetical protein
MSVLPFQTFFSARGQTITDETYEPTGISLAAVHTATGGPSRQKPRLIERFVPETADVCAMSARRVHP